MPDCAIVSVPLRCFLVVLAMLFGPSVSLAQPVFDVNTGIRPCDDYATDVLHNPWDMSDTADVNNFITSDITGLTSTSIAGGLFNFTNATAAAGHFYLLTPQIDNLQPVGGRWGQNFPIDPRYRTVTIRMNATAEPAIFGLRILWHRGKSGAAGTERTITNLGALPVFTGYRTYQLDLAALTSFDSASMNPAGWSTNPIHGFGIYPIVSPASGQIDYIRLEDQDTCGTTNVSYTTSTSGNNDLLSFYLDDDSNPLTGFQKKLSTAVSAASNSSLTLNALGLQPGSYKLVARFDSDFATLERDNEWDMSESTDLSSFQEISGGTFNSGAGYFSGTTNGSSPSVFFDIPTSNPISGSKYNKISLKASRSVAPNTNSMYLVWEKSGGGIGTTFIDASNDMDSDGVYHIDLSGNADWAGQNITSLRLQMATGSFSGITFALDFLQIRKTGSVTAENTGSTVVSSGNLIITDPPKIVLLQPDIKGGELFKPWAMTPGDFGFSSNADSGTDSSFPNESLTSYLPDVRTYDGVRGDLYKATNIAGIGDPSDFLNFPSIGSNNYTINADEYSNLCIRMALNRDFDLGLGSVTKHFYKRTDGEFQAADAWATILDRWSSGKWYEYCLDASNHPTEDGLTNWGGTLEGFRVDPHEFSFDSCCDANGDPIGNPIQVTTYYDYIRLAKRDRSYGKFTLPYQVQDNDTTTPTVTWLYSTTSSFASSTPIPSGDLSCQGQVCIWNTNAVTNGDYFVKAVAADGSTTNSSVSSSFLKILNGQGNIEVAPILTVENPVAGRTVCDHIQIKGYAVNDAIDEPVVALQVFFDGTFQELVVPSEYSPASRAAYPARLNESGFNFTLPVADLAVGSHTVTIRAYSSNGGIATQNIGITKASGCVDSVVSDNSPSGSPVAGTVVADNTPTPAPSLSAPKIKKATLSATGIMQISLSGLSSAVSGCNIQVSAGSSASALSPVKSFLIARLNASSGKYSLAGKGLKINKKKLKKFLFGVQFDCSSSRSQVTTKAISPKTTGGASNIQAVISVLKKKLKKAK